MVLEFKAFYVKELEGQLNSYSKKKKLDEYKTKIIIQILFMKHNASN